MTGLTLRPAEPERDFAQLAAGFTLLEDETSTEASLKAYYEENQARIRHQVAEDAAGELLGFYWVARDRLQPDLANFSLFVRPESRRQGTGRVLYADLLAAMRDGQAHRLRVNIWDDSPDDRSFAEHRGFTERSHALAMALDLCAWDDRPYDEIIARLRAEGFQFTSMAALGDTEDAQRKLYALNDITDRETMGGDGAPSWASFEDFQQSVCRSNWYRPDGQMVAIDLATGDWAAMSAISRFDDYAYNLHTGVDRRYRGRKLAQAVEALALRYARDVLQVSTVRTHHNSRNAPMIAIDRKLGYAWARGLVSMEKVLKHDAAAAEPAEG